MVIVIIRAIILYIVVLFAMRIMGKGELGELQPFDLVVTLMIAELASMPMEDLDAPLLHGFTSIATLMFLQCLISYISLKSNKARRVICGTPSILIEHGKFNIKEMRKIRVNVNDVLGQLRNQGYSSIDDIDYLIMETNGQMSIIAPSDQPGTKVKRLPISIIIDGRIMSENLNKYNIKEDRVIKDLEKGNYTLREIIYGFVDENNKCVFYSK